MGFFTRWFSKKPEDDATILSNLALDVQQRETRLAEIRLRERRFVLSATLWTLAFWLSYLALWYENLLPAASHSNDAQRAIWGAPVVVGPIIILFTRRLVQIWYARVGNAEEEALKKIRKKQRDKIAEIKKKTNYDSTRSLIEKYDDSNSAFSTSVRRPNVPMTPAPPGRFQQQPQGLRQQQQPQQLLPAGANGNLRSQLPPLHQPVPTPRKQWYDKVADALLGDEDSAAGPASSRYALICEKCYTHNGLVPESKWMDAQFACMKCGHMNLSERVKRRSPQPNGPRPSMGVGDSPVSPLEHRNRAVLVNRSASVSPVPAAASIQRRGSEDGDTSMEANH